MSLFKKSKEVRESTNIIRFDPTSTIVLIPYSSCKLIDSYLDQIGINNDSFKKQVSLNTPLFQDELFQLKGIKNFKFNYSKYLCDILMDESNVFDSLSKLPMPISLTSTNKKENKSIEKVRKQIVKNLYHPFIDDLNNQILDDLNLYDKCFILVLTSFIPNDDSNPNFVIGRSVFNTPKDILDKLESKLAQFKYSYDLVDFESNFISKKTLKKSQNVFYLLLGVNQSLYLDPLTFEKKKNFDTIKENIVSICNWPLYH